jgi:Domain of unknown function (DUF4760)
MVLINTNGMSFIGLGSEWFWTAISGLVLATTFIAIYRQLAVQRSAAAIEQHSRLLRDWHSELMLRSRIAVLTAYRDGAEPGDPTQEIEQIGNFWEGIGHLVRSGHVDRRLVYNYFGNGIQIWWALLNPTLVAWRADENGEEIWEEFEWLTRRFADIDRKAGRRRDFSEAYIRRTLPAVIDANSEALRTAEAMRSIILQPAPKAGRGQRSTGASRSSTA